MRALGLLAQLFNPVLSQLELTLSGGTALHEVLLGLDPPRRERGLEVGRGLGSAGALLLIDGLGLFAARRGVAIGVVEHLIRRALGVFAVAGGVGVCGATGLLGVAVCLGLHCRRTLVDAVAVTLGVGSGLLAQPLGLLISEGQNASDAFAQGLVSSLRNGRLPLLFAFGLESFHPGRQRGDPLLGLGQLTGGDAGVGQLCTERPEARIDLGGLIASHDGAERGIGGHGFSVTSSWRVGARWRRATLNPGRGFGRWAPRALPAPR